MLTCRQEPASYTPANETADLVSLNMAVFIRSVSDMHYDPKTLNRRVVFIFIIV